MRLVVGITGASGSIYGIRLLEVLRGNADVQTHVVISAAGKRTLVEETRYSVADVEALANNRYDVKDIGASIASGSFRTGGMVIASSIIAGRALAPARPVRAHAAAGRRDPRDGRLAMQLVRRWRPHELRPILG